MVTIAQAVTTKFPQTEADLAASPPKGLAGYAMVKVGRITYHLESVTHSLDESSLPAVVVEYLALLVTADLFEVGADYYKTSSQLGRSHDGSNWTDYDRVTYCVNRAKELRLEASGLQAQVDGILNGGSDVLGLPISTWDGTRVTPNPHRAGQVFRGFRLPPLPVPPGGRTREGF